MQSPFFITRTLCLIISTWIAASELMSPTHFLSLKKDPFAILKYVKGER